MGAKEASLTDAKLSRVDVSLTLSTALPPVLSYMPASIEGCSCAADTIGSSVRGVCCILVEYCSYCCRIASLYLAPLTTHCLTASPCKGPFQRGAKRLASCGLRSFPYELTSFPKYRSHIGLHQVCYNVCSKLSTEKLTQQAMRTEFARQAIRMVRVLLLISHLSWLSMSTLHLLTTSLRAPCGESIQASANQTWCRHLR